MGEATIITGVYPNYFAVDIAAFDNQGQVIGVIANVDVPGTAIPAGISYVEVSWVSAAALDACFIRWGAAASTSTGYRLQNGDRIQLAVPASNRTLHVKGATGVTGGSSVNVYPIG